MTGPVDTAALVAQLDSDEFPRLAETIDRVADALRAGAVAAAAVAPQLQRLARHDRWQVRKSVAHAAEHVRDQAFYLVIAPLVDDDNAWVREAARRAVARRNDTTHTDVLKEEHADLMARLLADLEARHGTHARDAAMRAGRKYAEVLFREVEHEITKVIAPLDLSLTNLAHEFQAADVKRDACLRNLQRAQDRLRLLIGVVGSLKEMTTQIRPAFHGEKLRELVDEAVGLVWDAARGGTERIALDIDIAPDLVIDADRNRLVQVFTNVLHNAVEAFDESTQDARIVIVARVDGDRVFIDVSDTGAGMASEAVRAAFKLFVTKKKNGTGFGLPLAKKIVESEHGGSITMTSSKDGGTTVTIVLPIEQEAGPKGDGG